MSGATEQATQQADERAESATEPPRRSTLLTAKAPGDVWPKLAASIPVEQLQFRQDGKPRQVKGRGKEAAPVTVARFVAYIDGATVRDRLDAAAPGSWSFTLLALPPVGSADDGVVEHAARCAFIGRLTIYGVAREGVGSGKDYKAAATDAFKRAGVAFGIGRNLQDLAMFDVPGVENGKFFNTSKEPVDVYRIMLARGNR